MLDMKAKPPCPHCDAVQWEIIRADDGYYELHCLTCSYTAYLTRPLPLVRERVPTYNKQRALKYPPIA